VITQDKFTVRERDARPATHAELLPDSRVPSTTKVGRDRLERHPEYAYYPDAEDGLLIVLVRLAFSALRFAGRMALMFC